MQDIVPQCLALHYVKHKSMGAQCGSKKIFWIKKYVCAICIQYIHMKSQSRSYTDQNYRFPLSITCFYYVSNYRFIDYRTSFLEKIIDSSISILEINISNQRLSIYEKIIECPPLCNICQKAARPHYFDVSQRHFNERSNS